MDLIKSFLLYHIYIDENKHENLTSEILLTYFKLIFLFLFLLLISCQATSNLISADLKTKLPC